MKLLLLTLLAALVASSALAAGPCDRYNKQTNKIKKLRKRCNKDDRCEMAGGSCVRKGQAGTDGEDVESNDSDENSDGRLCNRNRWCQGTEDHPINACVPRNQCNAPNDSQRYNDDYHKPSGTPTTEYAEIESGVGMTFGKGRRPIASSKLALAGGDVDFVFCKILCNEHPQCGRIMFASTSAMCKKNPSKCLSTGDKRSCKLLPFEWTGKLTEYTSRGDYDVYGWNYGELPEEEVPESWSQPECEKDGKKCNVLEAYLWNTWFDKADGTAVTPCFMYRNDKEKCMAARQEHGCTYNSKENLCGKVVMMYGGANKLSPLLLVNEKGDAHLVTHRGCKLVKDNNYPVTGLKPDYKCEGGSASSNGKKKGKGKRKLLESAAAVESLAMSSETADGDCIVYSDAESASRVLLALED